MLTLDPDGEKVKVDTEDTAAVLMRFENGGIGTLLLSETAPGHSNDLSIEVSDLRNSYKWEELHPENIWYSEGGEMKSRKCTQDDTVSADSDQDANESSEDVREKTFTAFFRDVYAEIAGEEHGKYPDFHDGAYIAAVCNAVKKSAETGEWVSV
jgi:predicted dehydrogenase